MKRKSAFSRIFLFIVGLLIIGGGVIYFCLTSTIPTFKEQTYELGDADISNNIEDYLKCSSYVRTRATLDTSKVDTQKVGDYIVSCHALKKDFDFIIHIVDTTEPEVVFNDVVFGTYNEYKVDEIASANDLSDIVRFEIIDSNNDAGAFFVKEPGKYTISLVAEDEYGNTATVDKEIDVVDAPHFILLNDRKYKIGNKIELLDFVYAEDKDGNDITDKISVLDDGGYDAGIFGTYNVTYLVEDSDGIKREQVIEIEVGDFKDNDFGYEREEFLSTIINHDYFAYTPLENNEDLDVVAELTSPTSFGIKGQTEYNGVVNGVVGSAFLYEITDKYLYFITNKHCHIILSSYNDLHLVDYSDNTILIKNNNINTYKCANKDIECFAIPIDFFDIDDLIKYKKVNIDVSQFDTLQIGQKLFVNTQEHGFIGSNYKDYIKNTTIRSFGERKIGTLNLDYDYLTTNEAILKDGQSGSPLFTYDGYFVAIATSIARVFSQNMFVDLYTRLPDILEFMNTVEIK